MFLTVLIKINVHYMFRKAHIKTIGLLMFGVISRISWSMM